MQPLGIKGLALFGCECGATKVLLMAHVQHGRVVSCGCYNKNRLVTHGHARNTACSKTYKVWGGMLRRCYSLKHPAYHRYGGRGITVCDKWRNFAGFLEDMGARPDGLELDRVDNDGPYCKENCRWATRAENANNRENNVTFTLDGETLTVSQWARKVGLKESTLRERLKRGWPITEALGPVPANSKSA